MRAFAVHPRLGYLAACSPREEPVVVDGASLRQLQRLPEAAGARALAWHPEGPSLAAYLLSGPSAAVLLLSCGGGELRLQPVHRIPVAAPPVAERCGPVGLALSAGHLVLGAQRELSVWRCGFSAHCRGGGPHLVHCADAPEVQLGEADGLRGEAVAAACVDASGRFIATLHAAAAGRPAAPPLVRIWAAAPSDSAPERGRGRRRHLSASPYAERPMGGEGAEVRMIALRHAGPVADAAWRPGAAGAGAVLATAGADGALAVWRESVPNQPLAFFVEALWRAGDLWADDGGLPEPLSIRWVQPREADAAGAPARLLKEDGHEPAASANPVPSSTLLALRRDGRVAVLRFEAQRQSAAGQPLDCRHVLLQVRLAASVAALAGPPALLHAVPSVAGDGGDALELWFAGAGGDVSRARLQRASTEEAFVAELAVAGGIFAVELAGEAETPEAWVVEEVAVHRPLGFVAVHVQSGFAASRASRIWIGEVPNDRATLSAGRYRVPDAALDSGGLGSFWAEGGVHSLCWAPGRAVPPMLLAIRSQSGGGELSACTVDPLRGISGEGAWAPLAGAVWRLEAVCAEDDERASLALLVEGPRLLLARLERPPGVGGAPALRVLLDHPLGHAHPEATRFAVEWVAPPQGAACGELVGQLAVWCAGMEQGEPAEPVIVHTLGIGAPGRASEATVEVVGHPLHARVESQVQMLAVAVTADWLVALTSLAQVIGWCLTPDDELSVEDHAPPTLQVHSSFQLLTRPHARQHAARVEGTGPLKVARPWSGGLPLSQSSAASLAAPSDALGGNVEVTQGRLSLHRFAGGGLGVLACASSAMSLAVPQAFLRSRKSSSGEAWHAVELQLETLPLVPEALRWTGDGCVLYAGRLGAPSGSEPRPSGVATLAARLPEWALDVLRASHPCPAYHPDTLIWLVRRGEYAIARRILRSLLGALQRSGSVGLCPLLDISFEDFHSGKVDAPAPSEGAASVAAGPETASALFGGDDEEDFAATLARLRREMSLAFEDEEAAEPSTEAPGRGSEVTAAAADAETWQLPADEVQELATLLQRTTLPLVNAHNQALLLVLLQDVAAAPRSSDLDECGRRFVQAFEIHAALHKCHLSRSSIGDQTPFLQHLSTEDICWALHSDCQGTIVARMLELLGPDLDWPALRRAGLGLWLTDNAALKTVLEALPRSIIKRQGQEIQPETVAVWYALLGRRTLLAALYRKERQDRVADFLANDLSEEPWRTKAVKNAFELVRQRRFELASAFFVFARQAPDAIDICVRYLDDWPLAALIAQCMRAEADAAAAEEFRRVLLEDLEPLAQRAGDPWLASLACWHAAEHAGALDAVVPPYRRRPRPEGGDPGGVGAAPGNLFSGGVLRHSGRSPCLGEFCEVLRGVLAKRHVPLSDAAAQRGGAQTGALASRAYLSRRQPLLSLPAQGAARLPWRTAVGACRAAAALFCLGGQSLLREDGSVVFAELAEELRRRLDLPREVIRIAIAEVCAGAVLESFGEEPWTTFTDVAPFYSATSAAAAQASPSGGSGGVADALPPYLRPYVGSVAPELVQRYQEEVGFCRVLRGLGVLYASRALVSDGPQACVASLSAIAWRCLPRLRSFLLDPAHVPFPAPFMHLALHLACAPCVAQPPDAAMPHGGVNSGATLVLPEDLAHVVASLAVALAVLVALRSLTLRSGLWQEEAVAEEGESGGWGDDLSDDGREAAPPAAPVWEPALWQAVRVLFEHLGGDPAEQRRLHRSGVLPSLVVSLFLQPALLPTARGTGAEAARAPDAGGLERLVLSYLGELVVERLVTLLARIRRKPTGAPGHWIIAWYEALLSALRALLDHVRRRVLEAAKELAEVEAKWPAMLCAPGAALEDSLVSSITVPGGAADFRPLWRQLCGTQRLQMFFAHHPALHVAASKLPRRSATLLRSGGAAPSATPGGAAPGGAGVAFLCADRHGGTGLAVCARGGVSALHVGHAARWPEAARAPVEPYLRQVLGASALEAALGAPPTDSGEGPAVDAAAELILGGAEASEAPLQDHGPDVARLLATLRRGTVARGASQAARQWLSAAANPVRPLFAAAAGDGSVHLWAFGDAAPQRALSHVGVATGAGGAGGGTDTAGASRGPRSQGEGGGERQRRCHLSWNDAGDRLLAVGSSTGVSLWSVGDGRACHASVVATGAAHAKVVCGAFVSPGLVLATAGRRADADAGGTGSGGGRAWPHVCAGLCVWDTLAPPGAALVAHDGASDAAPAAMQAEYTALAWEAGRQRLLCGTKEGELRIFDLRMQRVAQRLDATGGTGAALRHCLLLPSTGRLATLSAAAELKIWSLSDFECLDTVPKLHQMPRGNVGGMLGWADALTCAALLSEHHLVTGGHDGSVVLTRL